MIRPERAQTLYVVSERRGRRKRSRCAAPVLLLQRNYIWVAGELQLPDAAELQLAIPSSGWSLPSRTTDYELLRVQRFADVAAVLRAATDLGRDHYIGIRGFVYDHRGAPGPWLLLEVEEVEDLGPVIAPAQPMSVRDSTVVVNKGNHNRVAIGDACVDDRD